MKQIIRMRYSGKSVSLNITLPGMMNNWRCNFSNMLTLLWLDCKMPISSHSLELFNAGVLKNAEPIAIFTWLIWYGSLEWFYLSKCYLVIKVNKKFQMSPFEEKIQKKKKLSPREETTMCLLWGKCLNIHFHLQWCFFYLYRQKS